MGKNDERIPNDENSQLTPFSDIPYYGKKTHPHDISESGHVPLRD